MIILYFILGTLKVNKLFRKYVSILPQRDTFRDTHVEANYASSLQSIGTNGLQTVTVYSLLVVKDENIRSTFPGVKYGKFLKS